MTRKYSLIALGLLIAVALPLEVAAALLAFETLGDIWRGFYFLAMLLNIPFLLAAFCYQRAAALGVIVLALAIVPYQAVLGWRLVNVQQEAARIVGFVYEQRLDSGEYPADLTTYEFHDEATRPYIQEYYVSDSGEDFMLSYRVGTVNTSHTYTTAYGWGYYPD